MVIDDDHEMRSLIEDYLRHQGYIVQSFSCAQAGMDHLQHSAELPELIVSDIQMPGLSGLDLAAKIKTTFPDLPIILVTAFGSIESAVEAIRRGAFDYITKPFKLSELILVIERALNYSRLKEENRQLRNDLSRSHTKGELIGKSKTMQQVFELIDRVAHVNANVLITGESGTGKEMVAHLIHNLSPRKHHPFVVVNCTAIPETLLESELFGHSKGAYTGAHQAKIGLFESANGGTLFLDEIGDMDISLQAKLLRVLQERKVLPVGETREREIDVRLITATHKDLKHAIKDHLFREDLYYRLAVVPISVPPLRHRQEDIPLLANYFLRKYALRNGVRILGFRQGALETLINMRWEGNVRELENMVERLVVLAQKDYIEEADIPLPEMQNIENFWSNATRDLPSMEQIEKRYIQLVLERSGGKKDRAAQILGLNRRTLYRKEREYGLVNSEGPDYFDSDEPPETKCLM